MNKELDETVKALKGDLPISDKMVKGWLEEEAKSRPGLAQAYLDRHKNPAKWEKIQSGLRSQLKQELSGLPSKSATDVANQVESAVRNAKPRTQNSGESGKKISSMTDAEFAKTKKARFAQAKSEGR